MSQDDLLRLDRRRAGITVVIALLLAVGAVGLVGKIADFQKLMDACFQELMDRRAESLKPWLEERFRPFRLVDSKEDAEANVRHASQTATLA